MVCLTNRDENACISWWAGLRDEWMEWKLMSRIGAITLSSVYKISMVLAVICRMKRHGRNIDWRITFLRRLGGICNMWRELFVALRSAYNEPLISLFLGIDVALSAVKMRALDISCGLCRVRDCLKNAMHGWSSDRWMMVLVDMYWRVNG